MKAHRTQRANVVLAISLACIGTMPAWGATGMPTGGEATKSSSACLKIKPKTVVKGLAAVTAANETSAQVAEPTPPSAKLVPPPAKDKPTAKPEDPEAQQTLSAVAEMRRKQREEEEAKRLAEEARLAKAEDAKRLKAERERSCVIKPVMTDAEIDNCKTAWK